MGAAIMPSPHFGAPQHARLQKAWRCDLMEAGEDSVDQEASQDAQKRYVVRDLAKTARDLALSFRTDD